MARNDHLPVFADAYRLALLVEQLVSEFSNRVLLHAFGGIQIEDLELGVMSGLWRKRP